jgi:hypothetical protein
MGLEKSSVRFTSWVESESWKATLEMETLAGLNPAAWNQKAQPPELFEPELKLELTAS